MGGGVASHVSESKPPSTPSQEVESLWLGFVLVVPSATMVRGAVSVLFIGGFAVACSARSREVESPRTEPGPEAVQGETKAERPVDAEPKVDFEALARQLPCPREEGGEGQSPPWLSPEGAEEERVALFRDLVRLATWERVAHRASTETSGQVCPQVRLEVVLEREPQSGEALVELALLRLKEARQRAGRIPLDEEVFRRQDGSGIPPAELGLVEKTLLRAASVGPESAKLLNALGVVAAELGEYARAEEYFVRAHRVAPGAREPLINRAGLGLELKRFDEAEKLFLKVLADNRSDLDARLGLSVALLGQIVARKASAEKRVALITRAIELLQQSRELFPDQPEILYNLASLFLLRAKYAQAPHVVWDDLNEGDELFLEFVKEARARPGYEAAIRRAACHYVETNGSYFIIELGPEHPRSRRLKALSSVCRGGELSVLEQVFE